ncbi:LysR family transcriptional regulator [Dickeya solani]|nr:LysR family transcriptional regulator [Dickeya solani]ANE74296.1 LysR family transcriptional regulator [Dickeya solani IPO 2222]AUC41509.1 transcriptional regulator, LysR family [Dickeya solani RNS 08.23.3.1.A]AUH10290.1 LysR family transcriptional regulator [Dickeya solani D s0432-1]AUH14233.1 LysR family transcriptional regulator [Dickeya solani]AYQ48755.1 HTH-type transcriptional activator CmpR [Dickeya solani]
MITFKQMDALIWIVNMGSFEAAASKLNMSQSAISKRIHEIEEAFDIEIFDRKSRNARLTHKGRELLDYCQDIVTRRDAMLERISNKKILFSNLRLGVTELTAMTWLPGLIENIRADYPKVQIHPTIDVSFNLFNQLNNDLLDIIIVPDIYNDTRFINTPLKSVENAWMCSPTLIPPHKELSLSDIANYSFLTQGTQSGTGLIYERYFASRNLVLNKTIVCSNLIAQVGLAIAGLGITYLPARALHHLITQGKLGVIKLKPAPPLVRYAVMYRADRNVGLMPDIANIAASNCNFDHFQLS